MKTTQIVIATRSETGKLLLWPPESKLRRFVSLHQFFWMSTNSGYIAHGDTASELLGGKLHGLRKGRKKKFKITWEVQEVK